ncbi:MAG: Rrf2 family transcriptional regulator [Chloroflexota bacterium]|nr:Rrf2 family transcriptional regulator [Chloroflexota bacterium]
MNRAFFQTSAKTNYGLLALLDLALRYGQGPVPSADIAARQGAPEAYLDQIMAILRRARLVISTRGTQGGHALAAPPASITAAQVVMALEGSITAAPGEGKAAGDPSAARTVAQVWQEAESAAESVLAAITLADLVARYRAQGQGGAYQI